MKQKFEAKLIGRGPGNAWTFLPIPFDVQKAFLDWIDSAKRPETRIKRLKGTIEMLETGKRRE